MLAVQNLTEFFEFIYGNEIGYAYIATKEPTSTAWHQEFFEWPAEIAKIEKYVQSQKGENEVYYAPALFKEKSARKHHILGSSVFWVDFDGNAPSSSALPEPSLKIRSSLLGREHWYWKADQFLSLEHYEIVNRKLAYIFAADHSGWDGNQVLRPPFTTNHKRGLPVEPLQYTGIVYSSTLFDSLPNPPPLQEVPLPENLPRLVDVIRKYIFPDETWKLFETGGNVESIDRSVALMKLGYLLAEINQPFKLNNAEIFRLLLDADERWGKFSKRPDRMTRLAEILTLARNKNPLTTVGELQLQGYGWKTLIESTIKLEWILEGFLQKAGYVLITGESGVGKTQLALQAAACIALGKDFLHFKNPSLPLKVGFLSLEMNHAEIKEFIATQSKGYSDNDIDTLQRNLIIFPIGEPINLNSEEYRKEFERNLSKFELDGILIDSLSSAISDDLSTDVSIRNFLGWLDSFRNGAGLFTGLIHHHRKATGDNAKPARLDDVYGSKFITTRATSVFCVWSTGTTNVVELTSLKSRLARGNNAIYAERGTNLLFKICSSKGSTGNSRSKEISSSLPLRRSLDI